MGRVDTIGSELARTGARPSHRHLTGSRAGTARLTGRQVGTDFDLTIEWPKPLYGDRTAQMKVTSLGPERFRIVVTDRIGVNGPVRATTDLTLLRHRRRRRRDAQLCRQRRGDGVRPAGVFRTRPPVQVASILLWHSCGCRSHRTLIVAEQLCVFD